MSAFKFFTRLGRMMILISLLALVTAWFAPFSSDKIFGLTQEHLFNDATVLALLGIAFLLDAVVHRREAA